MDDFYGPGADAAGEGPPTGLLTEAQIAALEKAKADEAHGEFESECPGYCGAQSRPRSGEALAHAIDDLTKLPGRGRVVHCPLSADERRRV